MRHIGLDVGDATIGVAVSDPLGLTAQGLKVIRRNDISSDFGNLKEIAAAYETNSFVLGLPKNMNGTEGERAKVIREFADELTKFIPNANITFWDERLTTVAAHRTMLEADVSRKKRKKSVDKLAAVFILQGFLDFNSMKE